MIKNCQCDSGIKDVTVTIRMGQQNHFENSQKYSTLMSFANRRSKIRFLHENLKFRLSLVWNDLINISEKIQKWRLD